MIADNEQIKKDIVDKLYWDGRVDAVDIKIDIREGQVKIYGSVPNYTAKQAAWEDAWITPGVKDVNDQIVVKYPTNLPIPKDEEIRTNVISVLSLNSSIDSEDIDVEVTDGKVVLEGMVDSYWQKIKAEDLVFDIIGVTHVLNKLSVVPNGNFLDKDIAEDIVNIYDKSVQVESEQISVKVEDGIVTLTGTVPNWSIKRTAVNLARFTPGVRDVVDYIRT